MALSKDLQQEIVRADRDPTRGVFSGSILQSEDTLLAERLGDDILQYEELELDCHISCVLQKRRLAVIGRDWKVENPDPDDPKATEATELVEKSLKRIDFDGLCSNALHALLVGKSFSELIWGETTIKLGDKQKELWLPNDIRGRSAARFQYTVPENDKPEKQCETVYGYELRQITINSRLKGEPIPKYRVFPFAWGSRTGNPNGFGLGNKLWWMARFKREVTKFWLIFLDRYAQPTPWGEFPENGSREELEEFLDNISRGAWGALPVGYKVNLLEATRGSTVSTYDGFQRWCDEQISKAVLGETLTSTPQADGGSYAATSVHNDVRLEIAKADADLLSGFVREYLIKPIVGLNLGWNVPIPSVYRSFNAGEDLGALASRDYQLFQMGFRRTMESVTEHYGDGFVDTQAQQAEAEANDPNSLENVLASLNGGDQGAGDAQLTDQPASTDQPAPEEPSMTTIGADSKTVPIGQPAQLAEARERFLKIKQQAA